MKEKVVGSCEPAGHMVDPAVIIQPGRLGQCVQGGDLERTASKQAALQPWTSEKGYGVRHMRELTSYEQMFDTLTVRRDWVVGIWAGFPENDKSPATLGRRGFYAMLTSGLRPC